MVEWSCVSPSISWVIVKSGSKMTPGDQSCFITFALGPQLVVPLLIISCFSCSPDPQLPGGEFCLPCVSGSTFYVLLPFPSSCPPPLHPLPFSPSSPLPPLRHFLSSFSVTTNSGQLLHDVRVPHDLSMERPQMACCCIRSFQKQKPLQQLEQSDVSPRTQLHRN